MSTAAELESLREENRKLKKTLESLENYQKPVPQQLRKLQIVTSVDYYEDENGGCLWNCGILPGKDKEADKPSIPALIRGEINKQDGDQETVTSVDYYEDEDENGGCLWNCGILPGKDEVADKPSIPALIRSEINKKDGDQELIRHYSALRIQGFVRGILVREEFRIVIREQTATVIQAAARGMMRREEVRKQLPALERARKKTIEKNRKALNRERKIQEKLEKKEEMNRLKQEKLERKMQKKIRRC
jgi:hypothetical protein